jgi:organic hydroperoxide reductase OsmC/OhrA
MQREHRYSVNVRWTGNTGKGTSDYRSYQRNHEIDVLGKPPILGSADPKFRGDPVRYNPEELLVSALSTCHMLWYLHLCADAGIVVVSYEDRAEGTMEGKRQTTAWLTRTAGFSPVSSEQPKRWE